VSGEPLRRREHEIEVPGHGRTVVHEWEGPPSAPVVVLLHGLGATARLNWGRCARPLSQRFRVLALDHRGHGRGLRTHRFSLEECADDAAHAARSLGVSRFVPVGYSMGGPIASLTWRRHPDAVAGLVLCATARHFVPRHVARVARATLPLAALASRAVPRIVHRSMVQRLLVQVEHPAMRDRIVDELLGHEPSTVIQAAEAVTRFASHDWIGEVDVPTAVVVTTADELVPASRQRKLAASIPGALVLEVDGDHDACVRLPGFAATLARAVEQVVARAGAGSCGSVEAGGAEAS